jgi:hypothetical protein
MKKKLIVIAAMLLSVISHSQKVKGSIRKGSASNKVDIVFLPDHTVAAGVEYVQTLSVSVAVPTAQATGLVPTITTAGTIFSSLSFTQAVPFSYTSGTETIYSWIVTNNTVFSMSWTAGDAFVGATITFTGGGSGSKVKLVDFTNLSGGDNGNTFFGVGINVVPFDLTDYSGQFFAATDPGGSTIGSYPSTDRFVETNDIINLGSLPVGLLNFSGYKSGSKNVLKWNTSSESNNSGFEVQRSSDGVNYSPIGFVNSLASGGNSSTELSYGFDDNNPVASKRNFYRLNQKDIDGRSKMSNVVLINGDKPMTIGIGGIFPNPASSTVNVIIDAPRRDDVTVVLMDVLGKTIKQKMVNVEIGSNTVPVEIGGLASGSYLVKVLCKSDCETAVSKFAKQ